MAHAKLSESDLVTFGNAAAGHEGVLSDPTGALVIKPCTPAEVAFYEKSTSDHPAFAALMPTFMGTLNLSSPEQKKALQDQEPTSVNAALQAQTGTAETLPVDAPGPMHGKKLETEQGIVLENIAAGFIQPNVLDVKLGAQLWDEGANEAKRARLDKVAAETTSSSLGFRIAGMKVWQPDKGDFKTYDKMYGRGFSAANVKDGFRAYFQASNENKLSSARHLVLGRCLEDVARIQTVLENQESRMYSASILFVFEGDAKALEKAIAESSRPNKAHQQAKDADGEDDAEDEDTPNIYAVKLIDFAHATWTPGQGPDENALRGVRSTREILEQLLSENKA